MKQDMLAHSTSLELRGKTEPRIYTPPLRELTPETSYGFDLIDFAADVVDVPFDPWQEWLAIHLGELLEDMRPRFRTVLCLVSRQNGKTRFAKTLTLYWLFVERCKLVLGTSTTRDYAKVAWRQVCEEAESNPYLKSEVKAIRKSIGEESLITKDDNEYKFAASNRRAGRSLTVHRLIVDEIREHTNWEAWNAANYAMNAVPGAQAVAISNQGDNTAVVLDSLRESALNYLETGEGDATLGLFEWSAETGCEVDDPEALAAANPDLGNRIKLDTLVAQAKRAKRNGGEELAGFRTETLCQRVQLLDAALDLDSWFACGDTNLDLKQTKAPIALCLDISLDGSHATLIAASTTHTHTWIDTVHAWDGHGCSAEIRRELPGIVNKIAPTIFGWFPQGPAAALAADLRKGWQQRGTEVKEITNEITSVCMGLAEQCTARAIKHGADPLLDAHISSAQRLNRGDAWVFTRKGGNPIDAAYACAGAVHLSRTLPKPKPALVAL